MTAPASNRSAAASSKSRRVDAPPPTPAVTVTILNRQRRQRIDTARLEQMTLSLLASLGVRRAELGIHLVAARTMAQLNQQYLQHAGSTDVITFDHSTLDGETTGAEPRLYGELFVCVDDAQKQAGAFRTTWRSEVVRYVVHGVLHLLGHDDRRPDMRRKMKRAENRLVRRLEAAFGGSKI